MLMTPIMLLQTVLLALSLLLSADDDACGTHDVGGAVDTATVQLRAELGASDDGSSIKL